MAPSQLKLAANRANAGLSTGPRTGEGKAVSARNATRHGLLSSRLFLDDEDPGAFQDLLADLEASLRPVGAIELALVERIAIGMWRQRRLVGAEAAMLDLARRDPPIARAVNGEMGRGFSSEIGEGDLMPFDEVQAEWCRGVLEEHEKLDVIDLATLPDLAPLIHGQLLTDAEEEDGELAGFLSRQEHGVTGYIGELVLFCQRELRKAEQRTEILAIAGKLRQKASVLPRPHLELLSRYQTTLDNQLYKALKALREAQEWRLKTLEVEADDLEEIG